MSEAFRHRDSWEVLSVRMPVPSFAFSALPLESTIVLLGGDVHHVFDVNRLAWTELPRMPTKRIGFEAVCIENIVFVMGGITPNAASSNVVEALTIRAGAEWETVSPMTTQRWGFAGVSIENSSIVVMSGFKRIGEATPQLVEIFRIQNKTWEPLPSLSQPRIGCFAAAVRNEIYVFGGMFQGTYIDTAESLNLAVAGTWEPLPRMPRRRAYGAIVVVEEFILLVGGRENDQGLLDAVDCFDTTTRCWVEGVPPLNMARESCAAGCVLQDEVFMFGGIDDLDHLIGCDSVEKIRIDLHFLILQRFLPFLREENVPLSLWPHLIANCPPSVIHSILCSNKFRLDSVLLPLKQKTRTTTRGKKRKATDTKNVG